MIRPVDRKTDRKGIELIDTSFETPSVFDMVTTTRSIELVERTLAKPLVKTYAMGEVFASWSHWDAGWVADDGGIRAFAAVSYEAWHERLVLSFLYVTTGWRRRGLGRALVGHVEGHGRSIGASHVWIETSSVNVPGVAAYARLGYTLRGADQLFYGDYMPGETAIFLAKTL